MKEKIRKIVYKFIKYEGITATIAAIVLSAVLIKKNLMDKQQITIIDWTMFTSIVVALLLNSISKLFQKLFMNKLEDSAKLTCDYDKLVSKYADDMLVYDNRSAAQENLRKLRKNQKLQIRIPVICAYKLDHCTLELQDSASRYTLPEIIQEHFDELFAAHSTSKVYNQLSIRVDDWKCENKKFIMKTSRTTYFDSLVTNRAMDFRWVNGLTVREQFEFGPHIHTLSESCLSNHIGFNGFVISSDGYIIFVKRGNKLSVGKGTYGSSVSASLKAKYVLDCSGAFTESGFVNGILQEIKDELKIPQTALEEFSAEKHLIAAYRDIVEGGKPQFLFFIQSYWTKDRIKQHFADEMKTESKHKKAEVSEDGKKFLCISTHEIHQICILPDRIIHKGKTYRMMPSVTASTVMLIDYLKERG